MLDNFFYNRNVSVVAQDYLNTYDLSIYKPIYGSSVNFASRINIMSTIDNSIRLMPNSENNISVKYNLKFILTDAELSNLIYIIEISKGYKVLKFGNFNGVGDSDIYSDMSGVVQDYSINKVSSNFNELNIIVINSGSSPIFNWSKSTYLRNVNKTLLAFDKTKQYYKYDIVYYDAIKTSDNMVDNFWIVKNDIAPNTEFSILNFTKNFIFDCKMPFQLSNKLDIQSIEYKNSFIQNVKTKENIDSLKDFRLKIESIDNNQAKCLLFFLEKKYGYRRFIYEFPFLYNKNKVFICTEWNHTLNYNNSNTIEMKFTEDPIPRNLVSIMGQEFIYGN